MLTRLFYFLLLLGSKAIADTAVTINTVDQTEFSFQNALEMLEEPSGELTFKHIRQAFQQSQPVQIPANSSLQLASASSTYWFKFSLNNLTTEAQSLILEIRPQNFREALLFLVNDSQDIYHQAVSGWQYAANSKNSHLNSAFEITLSANQRITAYIKLRPSYILETQLTLWRANHYGFKLEKSNLLTGIFLGAMLVMLLYNFIVFLIVKERVYLYYVGYVASFTFLIAILTGLANVYLWPDRIPTSNNGLVFMLNALVIMIVGQFGRELMNLEKYLPRWDMAVKGVIVVAFLLVPAAYLFGNLSPLTFNTLMNFMNFVSVFLAVSVGITAYLAGIRAARYFLSAWSIMLFCVLLNVAAEAHLLPYTFIFAIMPGAFFEVVLFSIALAARINAIRNDKINVQMQLLEAKTALNQKLEQQVVERTQALVKMNETLKKISNEDVLTRLYNRRCFNETLKREWSRLQRQQLPLSLIMCDIDYFKPYNDNYGHQAGDECLQEVASVIKQHAKRSHDVAVRYGGEEFAIILPETKADAAKELAEIIRQSIAQLGIPHDHSPIKNIISMSFGVASVVPDKNKNEDLLIKIADKALYQSKESGRDRVSVYVEPVFAEKDLIHIAAST